jgi:hypothetical protein
MVGLFLQPTRRFSGSRPRRDEGKWERGWADWPARSEVFEPPAQFSFNTLFYLLLIQFVHFCVELFNVFSHI